MIIDQNIKGKVSKSRFFKKKFDEISLKKIVSQFLVILF